ncbi:MAG: hypothetical protein WC488_02730 [Candidatus Micrarchaeia archaeon]
MRGYLSFLLVLAALAILILLANSYTNSKSVNLSGAIALERMEQLSLDAKRSMLVSAKYGAMAGFLGYMAEIASTGGIAAFDPAEAKERVKDGAYASLLMFNPSYDDFETSAWCGELGESEVGKIAEDSLLEGAPKMCLNCQPIQSPLCRDYINVNVLADPQAKTFSIADLSLGSMNLGGKPKLFGITFYSQKLNISKVSYIPTSEKIFEIPYQAPPELMQ